MELGPGSRVDRYILREQLGEGGQGSVWKAEDPLEPGRLCAIKLVPVNVARPTDLERTRREARALARLSHASLVPSHALFEDLRLGVLGIAMELVDGDSLRKMLTNQRFDMAHRDAVLLHVARALSYLHEQGIVHRDVKLDNVLVKKEFWDNPASADTVKLVDLGLASVRGNVEHLTALGTVMGTVPYLAPELIDPATFAGDPSAPTVDVFAFGVMAYQLVAGRHPTGLPPNSQISDYVRAYRTAHEKNHSFPEIEPEGPIAKTLRDALALSPKKRIENGSELVARLGGQSGVVVRPLISKDDIASAPTSVASPAAMRDATAAIVPTALPAKKKSSSGAWIAAGTLALALALGVVVAQKIGESSSSAVVPSASSTTRSNSKARPIADAGTAIDATAEAAAVAAADECPDADLCSCCPSGHGCGPGGCDAKLDPENNWMLRIGAVEKENDAGSLTLSHPTAVVCLAHAGDEDHKVCTRLADAPDGGTKPGLNLKYSELVGPGIDIVIGLQPVESLPAIQELGRKNAVRFPDLSRRALCSGLSIEFEAQDRQGPFFRRALLWLDDPGDPTPKRCR